MAEYRYIYHRLRTEEIIAELPLFGTYMDLELNKGGRLDGSFSLDQTGLDNSTVIDATIPGRCGVVVERNGDPIWTGFVWSRTYQSQSKSIQLYHQSFENFPQYQLNLDDVSYFGNEQIDIFRDLWTRMQAVLGRNMNINLPPSTGTATVFKALTLLKTDFKYYGELMSSLADATDGFDWTIDVIKSGNQYVKTLRWGYPTLGSADPSLLVFEYPGSILNYYATESMTKAGTNVFAIGGGSGSEMLFVENKQDLAITQGATRWDTTVNRKDIADISLLTGIASLQGANLKPPVLTIKPEFKSGLQPEFGSFGLGDAAVLNITDPRFPNGFKFNCRVVKWTLQPQSAQNVDYYNLVFAGDDSA